MTMARAELERRYFARTVLPEPVAPMIATLSSAWIVIGFVSMVVSETVVSGGNFRFPSSFGFGRNNLRFI